LGLLTKSENCISKIFSFCLSKLKNFIGQFDFKKKYNFFKDTNKIKIPPGLIYPSCFHWFGYFSEMTEKLPQCVEDNKCFYYYHLSKMPNSAFNKHIDIVELKYEDGMFISFASFSMYPSVSNTFYNFSLLRDIEKNQEKFTKIIREAKRRVLQLPL
jgi:hypothetical protein